jgi:hypothetical protein
MLSNLRFVIGAVLVAAALAVIVPALFTSNRLTHQAKVGPLETSRNLPFDDRSDWNQFYDPESTRRFEELARKPDASTQQAGNGPADAAPAASTDSEVAALPPDAAPSADLAMPSAADLTSTEAPREMGAGEAARPKGSAAPTDEPRETGTLSPASAARTPGQDNEASPMVPDEPPAAAQQAAPTNAIETQPPKNDNVKSEAAKIEPDKSEPAKTETKTETPVPVPAAKPAAAPTERKAKPVVRAPAPKPRVAAPAQQNQQNQQYWQPQQNWQPQQYAPQQYSPPQSAPRQQARPPSQNDSFGQPISRSNSQFGG